MRDGLASSPRPRQTQRLGRVSTVEALSDSLVQRILNGEFAPGTALREVELADEYQVGRQSLRAALQGLAHAGLLRHVPNRGIFVPLLTDSDVADIFRLRTALEVEAICELAGSGADAPEVANQIDALRNLPPETRWSSVVEADLRIHRAIVETVRSPRLDRAYSQLQMELRLCLNQLQMEYEAPELLVGTHTILLDAIRSGDPAVAAAAIRDHITASIEGLRLGTYGRGSRVSEP